ncbi:hypothetical protein JCM10295v2_004691 [Rhodotorula toruloides]
MFGTRTTIPSDLFKPRPFGINFAAPLMEWSPDVARAPQHSATSHGVVLPPPHRRSTPSHGLPPTIPDIGSPVGGQALYPLPPIQIYEEWLARHGTGQHSLAKKDKRLGSSMTARKAAIYGTTPEEWAKRSAYRL